MPTIGATDPADLEAKARADLGFSRQLEQFRRIFPPPSLGGSGYALWYRQQQLLNLRRTLMSVNRLIANYETLYLSNG
jgi:hypothetical protein